MSTGQTTPPRAAAQTIDSLTRISKVGDRQAAGTLMSDSQQVAATVAAITAHGYEVGERVEALNTSGGLAADSPKWQHALRRVRDGLSAGVAVQYLDRLSRDVKGGLTWIDDLASAGGVLIAGGRVVNPRNPHERAGLINELNLSEMQLNLYRERSQATMQAVKARGVSNRVPFGYRRLGENGDGRDPKTLVPDDKLAPVVAGIFALRADGAKWPAIIGWLHEQGVSAPGTRNRPGAPWWTATTLGSLIANRAYVGEVHMGGHVTRDAHLALVGPETFRAAQSKARQVRTGKNTIGPAGDVLRCSGCGGPMIVRRRGKTATIPSQTFYGCRRTSGAGPCPAPVNGAQQPIDDEIDRLVAAKLDGHQLGVVVTRADVEAAEAKVRQARAGLGAYLTGTAGLGLDAEAVTAGAESHQALVSAAQDELAALLAQASAVSELPASGAAYRALPVRARRKMAAAVIASATLQPFPVGASKRHSVTVDRLRVVWHDG